MERTVVIAGVGAVTGMGATAADLWDGARSGRVAIAPVQHLPMDGYRTRLAGEVTELPSTTYDAAAPGGFVDRAHLFAVAAAEQAVAGLDTGLVDPARWAVVLGTCNAGLLSFEEWYARRATGAAADPRLLLYVSPQSMAEAVAAALGARGPVLSVNTACASGANAVGWAADLVRSGRADIAVAGGADALSDVVFAGFNSLESLSPRPAAPYSKGRDGLSLGEGAGMLVLTTPEVAAAAGARVLAEVAGYGLSADGHHPTAPDPEGRGAARAIRAALASAGTAPGEIGYVNGHGTGTAKNDPAETKAIRLAFGGAADALAVSSTKSMIGHLLGAAGAVEAIVTANALAEQLAPPTAGYDAPDPQCDLDYVPRVARAFAASGAVSNNFAFGGANASIVLRRSEPRSAGVRPREDGDVVVTGLAAITPAGDLSAALIALAAGDDAPAVSRLTDDAGGLVTAKERRRMDRLGVLAVAVTRLALSDSGWSAGDRRDGVGVVLGTGIGPMESTERFMRPLLADGPAAASPAVFPNTVYNAAAGHVAMLTGTLGPTSTVTAGHAAGLVALGYGAELVASGRAESIVAIGADTLTDTVVEAYGALGALGSGLRLAEAAIGIVLEPAAAAVRRGARTLGRVAGFAVASDARGVGRWDPWGGGIERAIHAALDRAGVKPAEIAAVWPAACGWRAVDVPERAALRRVFGGDVLTVSTAAVLGAPIGAGGALAAALAVAGWHAPGSLPWAPHGPTLVLSSSLGGTHAAAVLTP